jgi:hypothetical protein
MGKQECILGMDFMLDWRTWRQTLKDAIAQGRKYGLADEEIQKWALQAGDYLAANICAGTAEEKLLKELWDIAGPVERQTLATLIFRLVDK